MSTYEPGACNIGGPERRRRYRLAAGSLGVAALYLAAVVAFDLPRVLLVGLVVPFSTAAEWLIQARGSFCPGLAFAGEYRFGGERGEVTEPSARERDQRRAVLVTVAGILAGVVATAAVYLALTP